MNRTKAADSKIQNQPVVTTRRGRAGARKGHGEKGASLRDYMKSRVQTLKNCKALQNFKELFIKKTSHVPACYITACTQAGAGQITRMGTQRPRSSSPESLGAPRPRKPGWDRGCGSENRARAWNTRFLENGEHFWRNDCLSGLQLKHILKGLLAAPHFSTSLKDSSP